MTLWYSIAAMLWCTDIITVSITIVFYWIHQFSLVGNPLTRPELALTLLPFIILNYLFHNSFSAKKECIGGTVYHINYSTNFHHIINLSDTCMATYCHFMIDLICFHLCTLFIFFFFVCVIVRFVYVAIYCCIVCCM